MADRYDILYGYAPSWKEWRSEQRRRKAAGLYAETGYQGAPWHAGWRTTRDGGYDYTGEWEFGGSWTSRKIIRPSYDLDTAVSLVVKISGRKPFGRCSKPARWRASIELGSFTSSFWHLNYANSCVSIADACRKAEKLSFLDDEVAELLKTAYSPLCARSLFRKEGEEYLPYLTQFDFCSDTIRGLELGTYFRTKWNTPFMGPDAGKVRLEGTSLQVSTWGYTSGTLLDSSASMDDNMRSHHAMVQQLGSWLPKPESKPEVPLQQKISKPSLIGVSLPA